MARRKPVWKKTPDPADYKAATTYLSLLYSTRQVRTLVRALRKSPIDHYSAKDLLRASGLPLLPPGEASVKSDLKKIGKGKPLSPVLLARGDLSKGIPLTVADGYHRICA